MQTILTVTGPAPNYNLTTEERARAELAEILAGRTVSSELLLSWIAQASGQCSRFCDRVFVSETVSEQIRVSSSEYPSQLDLRRFPLDLASITVIENDVLLDPLDYEADDRRGKLYRLTGQDRTIWPVGRIEVDYTAGYVVPDTLPAEVERACLSAVRAYAARHTQNPLIRSEEVPGALRFDYQVNPVGTHGDLPPDAIALLGPFVIMTV